MAFGTTVKPCYTYDKETMRHFSKLNIRIVFLKTSNLLLHMYCDLLLRQRHTGFQNTQLFLRQLRHHEYRTPVDMWWCLLANKVLMISSCLCYFFPPKRTIFIFKRMMKKVLSKVVQSFTLITARGLSIFYISFPFPTQIRRN